MDIFLKTRNARMARRCMVIPIRPKRFYAPLCFLIQALTHLPQTHVNGLGKRNECFSAGMF